MKKLLYVTLAFVSISVNAQHPSSFDKAQEIAEYTIYQNNKKSFYCGCSIDFDDPTDHDKDGNKTESVIFNESCGYQPRRPITRSGKHNKRTSQVEWEHVVPASHMGGHLDQWKNKKNYDECKKNNGKYLSGRDCAYKLVPDFKKAHDDLHNLVPSVGELNADRSDRHYGEVSEEPRAYGKCDFEVDFATDKTEPADSVKGDIARIYFYMMQTYKFPVSESETQMYQAWDKLDPVDTWECQRDKLIAKEQGNHNPFVEKHCRY